MKESFSKSQATVRDFLLILFHRKKYFLLPALVVFFTASFGSFFLPKYYSSSVLLLVQEEKVINPLSKEPEYLRTAPQSLGEQLRTLSEKILNYPQLVLVVNSLDLGDKIKNPLEQEKMVFSIRNRTRIKLRSSEVIEISYEDKDPNMAKKLVNILVNSFIEYNRFKKEKLALTGVTFAEEQAEVYREKLEESEKVLYEFQSKFLLQKPGKDTDINISMLVNYQTILTNTQLSLEELQTQLNRINDQLSGQEPVVLSEELLNSSPIITTLNEQLQNRQIYMDNLIYKDPSSSQVMDVELEIDNLRGRLSEETDKMVDSQTRQTAPLFFKQLEQKRDELEVRVNDYKKREYDLRLLVDKYESRIASLPEQDRIYVNLQRDSRVNSNIYEMLRFKVEENRLDTIEIQQKGTQYEVIEEGRVALKSSRPKKLIISIVAFILGILTGFGCVFLVEMGDHSFRNPEDALNFLNVPVVFSTMKILTRTEYFNQKRKQRKNVAILVVIFALFFIAALMTSYVQEKKLTEKVIREKIQDGD
ncbi:MAG: GNVR domain-containing protein [Candidatus Omnitrophota bacterium]